jgi:2-iminobutanoate/2-iminopropanoate deaminase
MTRKIISTMKAPAAIGPYSQAVYINGMLFISGQIALNPETSEIHGETVAEQTKQVLSNIRNILEEAGYTLSDVAKTTCYLSDLSTFTEMNEVYATFFTSAPPARATVEVSKLPRGAKVEIEAIAVKS